MSDDAARHPDDPKHRDIGGRDIAADDEILSEADGVSIAVPRDPREAVSRIGKIVVIPEGPDAVCAGR